MRRATDKDVQHLREFPSRCFGCITAVFFLNDTSANQIAPKKLQHTKSGTPLLLLHFFTGLDQYTPCR